MLDLATDTLVAAEACIVDNKQVVLVGNLQTTSAAARSTAGAE